MLKTPKTRNCELNIEISLKNNYNNIFLCEKVLLDIKKNVGYFVGYVFYKNAVL